MIMSLHCNDSRGRPLPEITVTVQCVYFARVHQLGASTGGIAAYFAAALIDVEDYH
jgi:hypothetical protein